MGYMIKKIESLEKGVEDLTNIVTQLTKEKVALKQTLKEISDSANQALKTCN